MARRRYRRGGSRWGTYVPVAERQRGAERLLDKLRAEGRSPAPVRIKGLKIATSYWGKAWCDHMDSCGDYSNRLPRGRRYVRNGSVIDLQIAEGKVRALVSGSAIYDVEISIEKLPAKRWKELRARCAGAIGSLIELLRGEISEQVMNVVADSKGGLFPTPRQIEMECSCPDWATMCKHIAATLYAVGARLDQSPELLFTLRGVDATDLVETALEPSVLTDTAPQAAENTIATDELSDIFGIDIASDLLATEAPPKARRARPSSAAKKPAPTTLVKLSRDRLERLQERAFDYAEASDVLGAHIETFEISRGRLYAETPAGERCARLTPVGQQSLALETPAGKSWKFCARGRLGTVFEALARQLDGDS